MRADPWAGNVGANLLGSTDLLGICGELFLVRNPYWTRSFSYSNVEVEQAFPEVMFFITEAAFLGFSQVHVGRVWDFLLPPTETAKYQLSAQGRENSVSRASCTPQPHLGKQKLWLEKGQTSRSHFHGLEKFNLLDWDPGVWSRGVCSGAALKYWSVALLLSFGEDMRVLMQN